jgi:hypothetical protein
MKRLIGAAILVLMVGACQRGHRASEPASGPTTASVGSAATASAPSAPETTACGTHELSLSRINEEAGAGHRVVTYGLVNNGAEACRLEGYAKLALFEADGRRASDVVVKDSEAAVYNVGGPAKPVTLKPGGKGVFFVQFTGIQATDKPCVTISKIEVTPPGEKEAIELADSFQVCTGEVQLSPIRPSQGALTSGNSGSVFY